MVRKLAAIIGAGVKGRDSPFGHVQGLVNSGSWDDVLLIFSGPFYVEKFKIPEHNSLSQSIIDGYKMSFDEIVTNYTEVLDKFFKEDERFINFAGGSSKERMALVAACANCEFSVSCVVYENKAFIPRDIKVNSKPVIK